MEDLFSAPERMVQAFEQVTQLRVCFHDLSGQLYPHLAPNRFIHFNPQCAAVKAVAETKCVACDSKFTRQRLLEQPGGIVKICHARLVEWTVPHLSGDRIDWVLFAGQRLPGKHLTIAVKDPGQPTTPPWPAGEKLPDPVDDGEALRLLELTRMLAARLREWRREAEASAAVPKAGRRSGDQSDVSSRAFAIKRFIQQRHHHPIKLKDLAAHLHISESRAGHAVRESCGASFIEMLLEARLNTAASLLQHSNLSILEAGARSGFGDTSNFHSTFKRKFGLTPHRFRRMKQGSAAV